MSLNTNTVGISSRIWAEILQRGSRVAKLCKKSGPHLPQIQICTIRAKAEILQNFTDKNLDSSTNSDLHNRGNPKKIIQKIWIEDLQNWVKSRPGWFKGCCRVACPANGCKESLDLKNVFFCTRFCYGFGDLFDNFLFSSGMSSLCHLIKHIIIRAVCPANNCNESLGLKIPFYAPEFYLLTSTSFLAIA